MKVELVTKEMAYSKYLELKPKARAVASLKNLLPGNCDDPVCELFMAYATLASELQTGEACIFINDAPAEQMTDFEIGPNMFLIGKICVQNAKEVKIKNGTLLITYHDGIIEEYRFLPQLSVWRFSRKNISVNVPSTSAN